MIPESTDNTRTTDSTGTTNNDTSSESFPVNVDLKNKILFFSPKSESGGFPDGSGLTKLSEFSLKSNYNEPNFSFDGTKFVFTDTHRIYTKNVNGSDEKLSFKFKDEDEDDVVSYPSFSPDGKKIVFVLNDPYTSIYTIDYVKGIWRNLKKVPIDFEKQSYVKDPVYTSNGEYIVCLMGDNSENQKIGVFNAKTGKVLTEIGFEQDGRGGYIDSFSVSRAQGTETFKIAAISGENSNILYTVNIDGTNKQKVDTNGFKMIYPTWSPDGKTIFVLAERHGFIKINTESNEIEYLKDENGGKFRLIGIKPIWTL